MGYFVIFTSTTPKTPITCCLQHPKKIYSQFLKHFPSWSEKERVRETQMAGGDLLVIILLLCLLLLMFPFPLSSLPLCTDLRAPLIPETPLAFCPHTGRVCCNSTKDGQLQKTFQALNVSQNTPCANLLKSILCAQCDPFSAELFKVEIDGAQPIVPILCNSSAPSSSASKGTKTTKNSFCSTLWNACQDVPISNSPFAPSLQGRATVPQNSSASTLAELWQSESAFCDAYGGESLEKGLSSCFEGNPVSHNETEHIIPPKGLCLEKIDSGAYLNMAPHPDGSNAAFFSDQPGRIFLAMVPDQGSGKELELDKSSPFIDLTDVVHYDASFGLMGIAFHPDFQRNGRFFASFNCDKVQSPTCFGTCSCNSDVNCDPSKLNSSGSAQLQPCRYHNIIAEYSANGTSTGPSSAKSAKASEVRRILTMGLPYDSDHGGQILFGPEDGCLYFMMGDGGSKGDPYKFSQNKKSLLGKILRLNVDNIPSAAEISENGFWGNYSVPQDNPYSEDKELLPEIWAFGLRNPWRCSFDAERPRYFICGDIGENQYEEVDVITKGGNYGWSFYEGTIPYKLQQPSGGNTTADTRNLIFPVLGYNHSDINKKEGSAAMLGGYFYRSTTDPCLYGSYLYADLYATALWAAAETPEDSGNFTSSRIPFSCAHDSPINCSSVPRSGVPALGYIYSFGQDNRKDVFILASTGVYRVVHPSRCNYACSKEIVTPSAGPSPSHPSSSSPKNQLACSLQVLIFVLASLWSGLVLQTS